MNSVEEILNSDVAGSYLWAYLDSAFSSETSSTIFGLVFLCLARLLPIIGLSPFLGARILPNPIKVILGLILMGIFLPRILLVMSTTTTYTPILIILFLKEIVVGFIIGFIMGMPFAIMQNIGFIIDHQRGAASLMVNDPTIQNQSSPFGTLFNFILIVVFYYTNGPFLFFELIGYSYEVIPPDRFFDSTLFQANSHFWTQLVEMLNRFMTISVQLAAPSLIIILMTDFFLGIANRLAPQVQITFLGMGLKSTVPLIVITLGWYLFIGAISKESYFWMDQTKQAIIQMGFSVDKARLEKEAPEEKESEPAP